MVGDDSSAPVWSTRWLNRLIGSSEAYQARLRSARGRSRATNVVELDLAPGHIRGEVVDRRGELHSVDLAIRQLSSGEQDDVITHVIDRAENVASLLDGATPPGLLRSLADLEVELFPGPGDIRTDCDCGDWVEPCIHAAAVIVGLASRFDDDPFLALELRGVARSRTIEAARRRRQQATSFAQSPTSPKQNPWTNWTSERDLGDPPADMPDQHDALGQEPTAEASEWIPLDDVLGQRSVGGESRLGRWAEPGSGPLRDGRTDAMAEVLNDAAMRAWDLLRGTSESMLDAVFLVDLARLASPAPDQRHLRVALANGLGAAELDALVDAWKRGGSDAVLILTDSTSWATDQILLSNARDLLVEAGFPRNEVSLSYNALGVGRSHVLVLSAGKRWYLVDLGDRRRARKVVQGPLDSPREIVRGGRL